MSQDVAPKQVFISHAAEDQGLAIKICDQLKAQGVTAWTYETEPTFGHAILTTIQQQIEECDHFLVILGPHSQQSKWVCREIGLAVELNKTRKRMSRPHIIGIRADNFDRTKDMAIQLHCFADGTPLEQTYNFEPDRYFDPKKDSVDTLANQLRIQTRFLKNAYGDDGELFRSSIKCYELLFPEEERDDPDDIERWINQSARLQSFGWFNRLLIAAERILTRKPISQIEISARWRSIYGVVYAGDLTVGMAYLSHHMKSHWCFGNYFGVLAGWRQGERAKAFLLAIEEQLSTLDPWWKGIVFEAEPIKSDSLKRILDVGVRESIERDEASRKEVRALRRLKLYGKAPVRANALVGGDGQPMEYWQPSMQAPWDQNNEVKLVLMTHLCQGMSAVNVSEVLDFVYDDLYGGVYNREYVASVKARVMPRALIEGRFAPMQFDSVADQVFREARKLDQWVSL